MTEIATLLQTAPGTSNGASIGISDWKLCVEILTPVDEVRWDFAEWDTDTWLEYEWTDISDYVRGLEWTRGGDQPFDRPRIGELRMQVDARTGALSPWNPDATVYPHPYVFGPGTVIRVGLRSATETTPSSGWIAQFCGIVDTWQESAIGQRSDAWCDVVAYETLSWLAGIDENALSNVEGYGDRGDERIERLLDAAAWPYGLTTEADHLTNASAEAVNAWDLQSTDMAANRLAECYQAADSCGMVFRTDRTGAALITSPSSWWWVTATYQFDATFVPTPDTTVFPLVQHSELNWTTGASIPIIGLDWYEHRETSAAGDAYPGDVKYVPYDLDSYHLESTTAWIANDIRMAREGGSLQVNQSGYSIDQYGRKSFVRTDLVNINDLGVNAVSWETSYQRGNGKFQLSNLDVFASHRSDDVWLTCVLADVGCISVVYPPDGETGVNIGTRTGLRIAGFVRSMTHRVKPHPGSKVEWSVSFGVDTSEWFNTDSLYY